MRGVKQIGGVCNRGSVKGLRPVCRVALKDFHLCALVRKDFLPCVHSIPNYLLFLLFHTSNHNCLTGSKVSEGTHPVIA